MLSQRTFNFLLSLISAMHISDRFEYILQTKHVPNYSLSSCVHIYTNTLHTHSLCTSCFRRQYFSQNLLIFRKLPGKFYVADLEAGFLPLIPSCPAAFDLRLAVSAHTCSSLGTRLPASLCVCVCVLIVLF